MDALSDVLRTVQLSGVIFLRADLGGAFGISMPPPTRSHPLIRPRSPEHRLVMFHIVREGDAFVQVEGFSPLALGTGDLIIIFDDLFHSLVDSPGRECIASSDLVRAPFSVAAPPVVRLGEGERRFRVVCGMLEFVDRGYNPLFAALPPFLHVPRERGPSTVWLQENVTHIIREAEEGRPGSGTLLSRLTEVLFVETLRAHLARLPEADTGWLAALRDPVVGRAIQLVHADPARPWTVASLAREAGASRSSLAARFTALLGIPPMGYLTRWRIRLGSNLLEDPSLTIAEVAAAVGYESESAFHRAYKREMGASPASWRRRVSGKDIPV